MRAVNLIPPEERRGERAPLRAGAISYLLVGALAVAVAGVSAVVVFGNQVSDREAEVATLEAQEAEARTTAATLGPYLEFARMAEARQLTVSSLANSRFDWERILRELAIVIPHDVWLVSVAGTVTPDVTVGEEGASTMRAGTAGPALTLKGCGGSHEAVARFAAALEDIDGVTRVGVGSSERSDSGVTTGASGSGGAEDCRTRDFIASFEIVVAFDEVQVDPASGGLLPTTPATPAADDGGVAQVEAESAASIESAAAQAREARERTDLVTGVVR